MPAKKKYSPATMARRERARQYSYAAKAQHKRNETAKAWGGVVRKRYTRLGPSRPRVSNTVSGNGGATRVTGLSIPAELQRMITKNVRAIAAAKLQETLLATDALAKDEALAAEVAAKAGIPTETDMAEAERIFEEMDEDDDDPPFASTQGLNVVVAKLRTSAAALLSKADDAAVARTIVAGTVETPSKKRIVEMVMHAM